MSYETPDMELIEINPADIMTANSGEDTDIPGSGHNL